MREAQSVARLILLPGTALSDADDATLAHALIAREPQAPRVLWQRFAPMVFRMLKRTLGPGHDLEDLAQEVFLCVFEKVRGLREPKALEELSSSPSPCSPPGTSSGAAGCAAGSGCHERRTPPKPRWW